MNFMKNKASRFGLLVFAFLFSTLVFATEVTGLYEVEIIANSQSAQDRTQAIKQALYAVLDRIVVADDISKIPVVQQMLAGAQHYVKQFQYSLISPDAHSDDDARLIRVLFNEDQILEMLRNSRVGIWSEIRPETLLWLVVEQDGKRQFYDPDTMPDIENALATASKVKGLPIIFPMMDLEEQQRISVSEVLGVDSRNLLAVSSRYEVPSIMAGRLFKQGSCWRSEWAFYFDDKIKQWSGSCQALKATVLVGVKGAYGVLANYYGIKPETPLVRPLADQ